MVGHIRLFDVLIFRAREWNMVNDVKHDDEHIFPIKRTRKKNERK